ncbi:hypothetical protein ACLKA7_005452 [Drosophila subpalustris]
MAPKIKKAAKNEEKEEKQNVEKETCTEPGVSARWQQSLWASLQEELGKFEGLTGVSSIAEHTITLRDNRPIKQRYYPKKPCHAENHQRLINLTMSNSIE